jgi:proteasome assembly chaperone 3
VTRIVDTMDQSAFPVATKLFAKQLDGHHTDFSYSLYADRALLIITQLGSAGTIIEAKSDGGMDGKSTYSTNVLLGKRDEPALTLCARRIVEQAAVAGFSKPMILCLGLKDHTPAMVRQVADAVAETSFWAGAARAAGNQLLVDPSG